MLIISDTQETKKGNISKKKKNLYKMKNSQRRYSELLIINWKENNGQKNKNKIKYI